MPKDDMIDALKYSALGLPKRPEPRCVSWQMILAVLFTGTLFFWVKGGHNFDQLWMQRWALLLIGASAVVAVHVGQKISWAFAPAVFFSLFSGLVTSFWFTRYNNSTMERIAEGISNPTWFDSDAKWTMQAVLRQDASRAIFALTILAFAASTLTHTGSRRLRTLLGLCGLAQALLIISNYSVASQWIYYSGNPSMGGAFVALSLFMLDPDIQHKFNERWRLPARGVLWGVGLVAILLTKATTPLLGLAGGMIALLFAKYCVSWKGVRAFASWRLLALSLIGVSLVFWVGYLIQGRELWNDTYRFRMWAWMYEFWWRQDFFTKLFGFGTGTMRTLLPLAQVEHGESKFWLFYLHNDWYTWVPELGIVGFCSNVLAAAELFRRSLKWPHFSGMLGCFGAVMLTGFPLHWPVFVFALVVIAQPLLLNFKYIRPYEGDL